MVYNLIYFFCFLLKIFIIFKIIINIKILNCWLRRIDNLYYLVFYCNEFFCYLSVKDWVFEDKKKIFVLVLYFYFNLIVLGEEF